ncbi:MAG: glycosyltransferase family 1 protein [Thermomicrobium sp.]|nr:glycosyltransferase family 1 protein [Thermomicrobium sp.]
MSAPELTVLLDGAFATQPRTGSGQYTLALWRELVGRAEIEARLALPHEVPPGLPGGERVVIERSPLPGKLGKVWWEQRGLPGLAARIRPALVHVPYFAAPVRIAVPLVVTVHDVIPLVLPEYRSSLAMRLYTALVRRTVRRATVLLTDSEWSKGDIVRVLGFPVERIRVVPLGLDARFRPADGDDRSRELAARYGLRGPVVLNLGGFDVRKNLPLLVRAFARALPELPEGSVLVIPGRAHADNPRLYPPLEPLVRTLGLERRVLLPGAVDEDEKVAWYRLASVYAYPSLYEGFGLSPLEAMACGVPVVAARCTSLPEVVGDAGLLVEPDEQAFARALVRVLNDAELRRTLRARGLARARLFTWQRTAEETAAVYREAIGLRQPVVRGAGG